MKSVTPLKQAHFVYDVLSSMQTGVLVLIFRGHDQEGNSAIVQHLFEMFLRAEPSDRLSIELLVFQAKTLGNKLCEFAPLL